MVKLQELSAPHTIWSMYGLFPGESTDQIPEAYRRQCPLKESTFTPAGAHIRKDKIKVTKKRQAWVSPNKLGIPISLMYQVCSLKGQSPVYLSVMWHAEGYHTFEFIVYNSRCRWCVVVLVQTEECQFKMPVFNSFCFYVWWKGKKRVVNTRAKNNKKKGKNIH